MTRTFTHLRSGLCRVLCYLLFMAIGPTMLCGQIQINISQRTDIRCFGEQNGALTANAMGGIAPYTYRWSTGSLTANTQNLSAGTYTVTATDNAQRTAVLTITLTQPTPLKATASSETQICEHVPDGKALVTPTGGNLPYTYTWSTRATTPQITGLRGGQYTVTVTDGYGCTTEATTKVDFWNEGLWLMDTVAAVTCFGAKDGFMEAGAMSGTPPYTYTWSNGSLTKRAVNLAPGTYTVTVTDQKGCSHALSRTVTEPARLTMRFTTVNAECYNSGSATVIATGGNQPYRYQWLNGSTTATLQNLAPQNYVVTITDAKGCSTDGSVAIRGSNTRLVLSMTVAAAGCATGGGATVSVQGGSGSYGYQWANGVTTATAENLAVGAHTVTVTDLVNKCTASTTAAIAQGSGVAAAVNIVQVPTCALAGQAKLSVSGGQLPYKYFWSSGETTETASTLRGGAQSVTVIDAVGCRGVVNFNLPQPPTPTLTTTVLTSGGCGSNGSARVDATGGAGNYVYLWSSNETTATATNLPVGTQRVTVTDGAGCSVVSVVTITGGGTGTNVLVNVQVTQPATCVLGANLSAAAQQGTPPFQYQWTTGARTASISDLNAGIYTVTVTDAGGCSGTASSQVAAPSLPTLTVSQLQHATCTRGGSVTLQPAGGTAPYTYRWSTGVAVETASNLSGGTYTVTLSDAAGCTAVNTLRIDQPTTLYAVINGSANAKCNSSTGAALAGSSGGTGPYTYLWSNGQTTATARNLAPGQYTVTVTDAASCTATTTVRISASDNGIRVGDQVWIDTDQNGLQSASETEGMRGITVTLYRTGADGRFETSDDEVVATTVTDAGGYYYFDCVAPGVYAIQWTGLSLDYEFSLATQGNDDCIDSDTKSNGRSQPFTIVAGQSDYLCVDAGVHTFCENVLLPGTIGYDQTICEGQTPTLLAEMQAPGGGSGLLQYQWFQLTPRTGSAPQWEPILGATARTYQPPALKETSYFLRSVRRKGCANYAQSNIVTVTVQKIGPNGCGGFILHFGVQRQPNGTVLLNWTAVPENALYLYTVERAADGQTWQELTGMLGKHDATKPNTYVFMDVSPLPEMNYYRIRRSENKGENLYSVIKSLDMRASSDAMASLVFTPNPVVNTTRLSARIPLSTVVEVRLFNAAGVPMYEAQLQTGDAQTLDIPMQYFPAGIYFAHLQGVDGSQRVIRLSKL